MQKGNKLIQCTVPKVSAGFILTSLSIDRDLFLLYLDYFVAPVQGLVLRLFRNNIS